MIFSSPIQLPTEDGWDEEDDWDEDLEPDWDREAVWDELEDRLTR